MSSPSPSSASASTAALMPPPAPRVPKRKRAQLQKISLDKLPLARLSSQATPPPPQSTPIPLLSASLSWVDSWFWKSEEGDGWWFPTIFVDPMQPGLGDGTSPGAKAFAKLRGATLADAVRDLVAQQYAGFAAAWLDERIRPSLSLYACFPPQHIEPLWLDPDVVNSGMVHHAITSACRSLVARQGCASETGAPPPAL